MGAFSPPSTKKTFLGTSGQKSLLDRDVVPFGTSLLGQGQQAGLRAGQIGAGSMLSLAGLERLALGGAESNQLQGASNRTLTDILGSKPQDIEDYIKSTITDPGLAAYEDFAPLIEREFSGKGMRFGSQTSRGLADLLGETTRAANAARATGVLGLTQQNLAAKLAAAQMGQAAPGLETERLSMAATTMENIRLAALEKSLGLPAGILALVGQVATQPTYQVSSKPGGIGDVFARSMAGAAGSSGGGLLATGNVMG